MSATTYDAEAVGLAWTKAVPLLVGPTFPLVGVHLTTDPRSPGRGAMAFLSVGPSTVDMEGLGHSAPLTWRIRSNGGEGGAKRQAQRGAQKLAQAARLLTGVPFDVVTKEGDQVRIRHAHTIQGPMESASVPGSSEYRVTATFVLSDTPGD